MIITIKWHFSSSIFLKFAQVLRTFHKEHKEHQHKYKIIPACKPLLNPSRSIMGNFIGSQSILFLISPNPKVERGLYCPTKQPRGLDLGDVGKEVKNNRNSSGFNVSLLYHYFLKIELKWKIFELLFYTKIKKIISNVSLLNNLYVLKQTSL